MVKVLLVEDDSFVRDVLLYYLEKEQSYEVTCAATAGEALAKARGHYDVILLDILLPDASGIDLCAHLRAWHDCPIIFVSCLDNSDAIVSALAAGGDDFIVKPFDNKVLHARIEANLRRWYGSQSSRESGTIAAEGLVLGGKRHTVEKNGAEIKLSETEYRLLEFFMSNPNRGFTPREIYRRLWGEDGGGSTSRTVLVHIHNLRQKIEDEPSDPRYIVTAWGKGYMFPVNASAAQDKESVPAPPTSNNKNILL